MACYRNAQGKLPLLFVLTFEMEALTRYSQHNSTTILPYTYVLPSTFMESVYFYTNILPNYLKDILTFSDDIPWIGTLTDDVLARYPRLLTHIDRILQGDSIGSDIQVFAFGTLDPARDTKEGLYWQQQEECCPGLWDILYRTLLFHGESQQQVNNFIQIPIHRIKSFDRLSLLIRPTLLAPFIQWLSTVWLFLLTDPIIQQNIWNPCTYVSWDDNGNRNLQTLTGHILLGNWLTVFYFSSRGFKIETLIEHLDDGFHLPGSGSADSLHYIKEDTCTAAPRQFQSIYDLRHVIKDSLINHMLVLSCCIFS